MLVQHSRDDEGLPCLGEHLGMGAGIAVAQFLAGFEGAFGVGRAGLAVSLCVLLGGLENVWLTVGTVEVTARARPHPVTSFLK